MSALKEIKEQSPAQRLREGSERPKGNYESGCLICWCLPIQHFKGKKRATSLKRENTIFNFKTKTVFI